MKMPESQDYKPFDFWEVKHAIDDEVRRLGWDVERCKRYILKHYGKDTRLTMSDEQLLHLLNALRKLGYSKLTSKKLGLRKPGIRG